MKPNRILSGCIFILNGNIYRLFITILFGMIFLITVNCKKDDISNHLEGKIMDIDGNVYKTLKLGNQIWMCENLKVTRFKDGTVIKTTEIITQDISPFEKPNYQWAYEGNESLTNNYGRLYTYYAIADTCGICPDGWRVPSDEDWTILTNFVGGESSAQHTLREMGFNLQYGGIRIFDLFENLDQFGYFWSLTYVDEDTYPGIIPETQVYVRIVVNGSTDVFRDYRYVKSGLSLRCIKDE